MAKLVRHLTSNEEIVSSNLAEGNFFARFNKFIQRFFFLRYIVQESSTQEKGARLVCAGILAS